MKVKMDEKPMLEAIENHERGELLNSLIAFVRDAHYSFDENIRERARALIAEIEEAK